MADYAAMFKQMDTDGKGGASKNEVRKFLQKKNSEKDPASQVTSAEIDRRVDRIFADVDKDESGSISLDEFVNEMKKIDRRTAFNKMFHELDKDGNGCLTLEEVRGIFVKFGIPEDRVSDKLVRRKMADADKGGDQKISHDEFMALVNDCL